MFRKNKDGSITTTKGLFHAINYFYEREHMGKAADKAMLGLLHTNGISVEELDRLIDKANQPPISCVALEASDLVHNDRRNEYGPVEVQFNKIATVASIACGKSITAQDIATINIAQKLVRESYKHNRDNLVDIAGYASLKQKIIEAAK